MATLKQRLHRKNSSGTYDTVHLESSSDLILRPSGRTVEQDLADYLPQVQNNDNVPESLRKLIVGTSTAWILGKNILASEGIPSGVICMWSGQSSNIPSGWALCNGQNGTPNLQDRFIVGAGNQYSVGATGGANEVTLTTDQMPSHRHNIEISRSGSVFYPVSMYGKSGSGSADAIQWGVWEDRINTMSSTGSDEPHENRPPYYALCFIMKL